MLAHCFSHFRDIFIDGQNLAKMSEKERTRFRREKIGFNLSIQ